jgi:hypothetical protein
MLDKGYTPEQIVGEANNSLITLDYVKTVINSERRKKTRGYNRNPFKPHIPRNKKMFDYYTEVGKEAFLNAVKTDRANLALLLGVTRSQLNQFITDYIRSRKIPKYLGSYHTYEDRLIGEGRFVPKPKAIQIQDIENLW